MNMGKTKIMVGGLDLDMLKRSGKVPCGVCQKGVGSNAILSCGGCFLLILHYPLERITCRWIAS